MDQWLCTHCETANDGDTEICEVCDSPKSDVPRLHRRSFEYDPKVTPFTLPDLLLPRHPPSETDSDNGLAMSIALSLRRRFLWQIGVCLVVILVAILIDVPLILFPLIYMVWIAVGFVANLILDMTHQTAACEEDLNRLNGLLDERGVLRESLLRRVSDFNRGLTVFQQDVSSLSVPIDGTNQRLLRYEHELLQEYVTTSLRKVRVSSADIPGIGPNLLRELERYGYRTAEDIDTDVASISGIGSVKQAALLGWRATWEKSAKTAFYRSSEMRKVQKLSEKIDDEEQSRIERHNLRVTLLEHTFVSLQRDFLELEPLISGYNTRVQTLNREFHRNLTTLSILSGSIKWWKALSR